MIRVQFANEVLQNEVGGNARYTTVTPREVVLNAGFESTDGVLGYLFQLTMANEYTPLEWDTAKSVLTDNGALPFDINRADADDKIRRTLGTMLGYPSYQLQ
jgi:hypothetical protein